MREMKDSGIEWIKNIPINWEVMPNKYLMHKVKEIRPIYNGEDIMDSKKCVCQWYERDLSVVVGSDEYSKSAGFGWRKISGYESYL